MATNATLMTTPPAETPVPAGDAASPQPAAAAVQATTAGPQNPSEGASEPATRPAAVSDASKGGSHNAASAQAQAPAQTPTQPRNASSHRGHKPSVTNVGGLRVLCIAELRGRLSQLNDLVREHRADVVVHTGNFGFFDADSIGRISPKTLRHIAVFSPLLDARNLAEDGAVLKDTLPREGLSELPRYIRGELRLPCKVYAIYGASEDISVVEKFKSGEYRVPNLHIIDEHRTHRIETPSGPNLRLMGLGGSLVLHRFFDNGDGRSTIAGTHGLMWTTALQVGQLVQTAGKAHNKSEIRMFVCHPCPAREPLLAQLAVALRADFTLSSGLHFYYGASFNEFTAEPTFDHFRGKLASARAQFMDIWETVEAQITQLVASDEHMKLLLNLALDVFKRMPISASHSSPHNKPLLQAFRNMWNFNLCDIEHGTLVLAVNDGKVSMEQKSQGFGFQSRKSGSGGSSAVPGAGAGAGAGAGPSAGPSAVGGTTGTGAAASTSSSANGRPPRNTPPPGRRQRGDAKDQPQGQSQGLSQGQAQGQADKPAEANKRERSADSKRDDASPAPNETANGSAAGTPAGDDQPEEPARPGVWVANGGVSEDEIRGFFADEDRSLIQEVAVRATFGQPDKKFALVYFNTAQEAQAALERADSDKAGRVSLIGSRSGRGPRGSSRGGGSRGGRGRGRGGFRGGGPPPKS